MVDFQQGQRPISHSSNSGSSKRWSFLLAAGIACFALAWPAQSQLASHQATAPQITIKASATTQPKKHAAPVQVDLPASAPIKIFPGFEEALVATGPVTDAENADLDAALKQFHDAPLNAAKGDDYSDYAKPLLAYIAAHPTSNWNTALYLNLGLGYYHSGYYSRALDAFGKSWEAGKDINQYQAHLMVDRSLGELAKMHARVGHEKELSDLLTPVVGKRPIGGPGAQLIQGAREALWTFHHDYATGYLCGPQALKNLLITLKAKPKQIKIADDARSGPHGFSLTQLAALADKTGFKYTLIKREPGQPVPVPSVVNWNVHHFAAITATTDDGKYVLDDPTFGEGAHELSQKAIDAEGSGYFLVPAKADVIRKAGWRIIAAKSTEAQEAYGMGKTTTFSPTQNQPCDYPAKGGTSGNDPNSNGSILGGRSAGNGPAPAPPSASTGRMSACLGQPMNVSLHIDDTPVGYKPQVGPSAEVSVFYNQREALQPATFSFGNLSPAFSHGWMAYIYDDPTSTTGGLPQRQAAGGGGWIQPGGYNSGGSFCYYTPEQRSGAYLERYPCSGAATKYVRQMRDGSQEVYNLFNGATTYPRIVYLTQVIDPQGNATTINYDSSFRITSTVDAMGRSTTYTYGLTSFPLLITQITDPFSRSSQFTYDTSQRLSTVTDPVGITSTYGYSTTQPTFITQLTTPYGTTTFNDGVNPNDPVETDQRSLVTTDPLGNSEYIYFYQNLTGMSPSDPAATVPSGMNTNNTLLQWRNTFFWDKHAFAGNVTLNGSGVPISQDFTKARLYHWVHNNITNNNWTYDIPESTKNPLENRVWYNYYNQPNPIYTGTTDFLTATGRVLDDGTSQVHSRTTNSAFITSNTDPLGRVTKYNWNANAIDLASAQQLTTSPSTYTTIASYGTYNSQHLPASYTDAAGKVWNYTYTTFGQIKTIKDPLLNVTTYTYDTSNRLSTIVDANSVTVLTLTYDSADRVLTRTDSQGYTLTYAYDNLDRVTSTTYPDSTKDLYDYTFQSGPYVGTASQELRKHTDRLGRVTTYGYDADQRLTSLTEPTSGTSTRTTQYDYYENGVLKDIIDANGNDTHWAIDIQSRPTSKTYQYGTASATTETYAYENTTSRLHSITDALGQVKTFTYDHNDQITGITYTSSVNATPNVSFAYDTYFPRITSMTDGTGTTSYGYTAIGTNGALKLASVTSPYTNGTIALAYDAYGRLSGRTIPGGNETFGYDTINRLNSHGTPLGSFTLGYLGETRQLTSQSVTNGTTTASTGWSYDTNANDRRLIGITNSGVARSYTLSYLNGTTQNPYDIQNITDTAATGHPWATQSHSYTFDLIDRLLTASATTPGNSTFAYDKLDNATTYSVPGSSTSPTYNGFNQIQAWGTNTYAYDADGNLTSGDGVKTYKYDAENRLIEIDYVGTSNKSVFTYDGVGHRISDTETVSGIATTTYYLWSGSTICQSRNSSQTVLRRDLSEGEYNTSTSQKLVYMPDQLGSARDVVDATTGIRVASYDFLPYGAVARSNVTNGVDFQYAGLFAHSQSGLALAALRVLDGATGRWINRDPTREQGGVNLYGFVGANPAMRLDPTGLTWWQTIGMGSSWVLGTTPNNEWFGPGTEQTQDMREASGVQDALYFWQNKNSTAHTCACGKQTSVDRYDVGFGLSGYINAGSNSTQQFVGSYTVSIAPDQHGNVTVVVANTTSLTSFFDQLWPNSWNPPAGYPGGNYTQYYTWTQPLSCQ